MLMHVSVYEHITGCCFPIYSVDILYLVRGVTDAHSFAMIDKRQDMNVRR